MTTERTFHPFQQLPVELRLEIWNLSLPAPQSLHASWRAVPLSTTSEEERILQRRIVSLRQRFDRPTNRARRVLRSAYQNLCKLIKDPGQKVPLAYVQIAISSGGSDDAIIPPTHNPALLGVNQEARAVALERYHYRPAYLRASPPRYIDFEFDTLCVQSAELFDFFEPIGLAVLMGADLKGAEVKSAGLGDISKVQRLAVHHYFHFHEEIFRYIESVMSILPHFESLRELEVTPHYDPVHSVSCPCRQWQ